MLHILAFELSARDICGKKISFGQSSFYGLSNN